MRMKQLTLHIDRLERGQEVQAHDEEHQRSAKAMASIIEILDTAALVRARPRRRLAASLSQHIPHRQTRHKIRLSASNSLDLD